MPDPIPKADQSNSWVMYDDLQRRSTSFTRRNSRSSRRCRARTSWNSSIRIQDPTSDAFSIRLPPGKDDPEADRKFRDPQQLERSVDAEFAKKKMQLLRGTSGWLPEAAWTPRKVYRRELGLVSPPAEDGSAGGERVYVDYYLVLAPRNECFQAQSWTSRNDHVVFRNEAEAMLKSVRFGPWNGKPDASTAPPAPPLR